MRSFRVPKLPLMLTSLVFLLAAAPAPIGQESAPPAPLPAPLALAARIPLADVDGRIDHLALDAARAHLFVAALAQGALLAVDLEKRAVWKRIDGLREPQGVLYLADTDAVWVAEGDGDALDVYAGATLASVQRLKLGPDADNLRYDAGAHEVWLGYASGALALIGAAERKALGRVRLAGHPEGFALETKGTRVFANVPSERGISVVERAKKEQVGFWPIESAQANYPIALLESEKRLAVGCRSPAKLVLLDTDAGKEIAALELSGDVDDLWYDEPRGRIYASCGEGKLDVFTQRAPANLWKRTFVEDTARGARTSLLAPDGKRLFVAVPKSGETPAEIRVYDVRD